MKKIPKKYLILSLFLLAILASLFLYKLLAKNRVEVFVPELPSFLKGIVYSPYYPGEIGGELLLNDDRYFDHLNKIKDLGANVVSVFPEKTPPNFFSALEKADLFYVPIININLYDGTDNSDLLSSSYQEKVIKHIEEIIDYNYSLGQPDRLAYFVLGYEINPDYLDLTDRLHLQETFFSGNYLSLKNRRPAEIALAKILDAAMSYEIKKYNKRHLYTHISFPAYKFLRSEKSSYVFNDLAFFPDFFDFISLNLYPSYFYPEEKNFIAYLQALSDISKKPLIISELGLSTAPGKRENGVPSYEDGSEKAAAKLFNSSASCISDFPKIKGLFFFEFMDEYWKNGEEEKDALIHNLSDSEEWFGLYEPSPVVGNFTLEPKEEIIKTVSNIFNSEIFITDK
jgi:hypothetical protein